MATAAKQKKDCIKKAVKFGVCGPIPGSGYVLSKLESKKPTRLRRSEEQFENALLFLKSYDEADECVQKFFCLYPEWIDERESCIQEIRRIADELDVHQRNINFAKLPVAGAGIVSSTLCISGLALAPVTFGTSLPLTISGTTIAIANAAADTGIIVADAAIKGKKSNEAVQCFRAHMTTTQRIQDSLNQLLCHHSDAVQLAKDELLDTIPAWNVHGVTDGAVSGAANVGKITYSSFFTLLKACKSLHFLKKGFALRDVVSASSKAVDVVSDVATGFKLFTRIAGFAFGAIGLALDLIKIVKTGWDLCTGSKTALAKELRKVADELEKEIEDVTRVLEVLSGDVEVISDEEILQLYMSLCSLE